MQIIIYSYFLNQQVRGESFFVQRKSFRQCLVFVEFIPLYGAAKAYRITERKTGRKLLKSISFGE